MRHGRRRAALTGLLAVLLATWTAGFLAGSTPAAAEEYRYWSYWQADGATWRYAAVGPGGARPADGAVEGWRFLVGAEGEATPPRSSADFDEICRGTEPSPGSKRVAMVVDYGTAADAPDGERPPNPRTACAVVDDDATGADVLAAAAEPRFGDDALVCAVDGYPRSGCAEAVSGSGGSGTDAGGDAGGGQDGAAGGDRNVPGSRATDATGGGEPRTGLLVGIGLLLVLGAATAWRVRAARRT